jgi:hypothetical protein
MVDGAACGASMIDRGARGVGVIDGGSTVPREAQAWSMGLRVAQA